jgi:putative integral membrane protein (TIGR02587 family)
MSKLALRQSHYRQQARKSDSIWVKELKDLVRGLCGGFLFGIPLLYTMEVWWIGSSVKPLMKYVALGLTFIIVYFLNQMAGFRQKSRGKRRLETLTSTLEAMALGVICATLMLILVQEITLSTQLSEAIGKVVYESIPFSIGVALANQLLNDTSEENEDSSRDSINATLTDIGGTFIGALVIGFNISPTDEVTMLSARASGPILLAVVFASLLISYGIVFEAGFSNQKKRRQQKGFFQSPASETLASYLVSLFAAAFMLWLFQQLTFTDPWDLWLKHILILGLPTTIGGAAGRLAV